MRHGSRKRRGAITVMTALIFFSLIICGGIAIDFSRIWTIRNELQSSADAGALAGALQLSPPRDTFTARDSAIAYAVRNRALTAVVAVDTAIKGFWDNSARTFTPLGNPTNAMKVKVSLAPTKLIMSSFGSIVPTIRASAVAWAMAPVNTAGCMKPWAIPYEILMYRINAFRGLPNTTTADLTRQFDPVADMAALTQMSTTDLTFRLKIAQNSNGNTGQVTQGGATSTSMPGNYQAVRLGKWWDFATQAVANPSPMTGANDYRDHINGTSGCFTLAVGDSLETETGNKVGPTIQGITPNVCASLLNDPNNVNTHGTCLDAAGNAIAPDIKAAFFSCGSGCNGQAHVGVRMLGSFSLKQIYPTGQGGQNPQYDKSEIVGVFRPIQSMGPVGNGASTIIKLMLVQ